MKILDMAQQAAELESTCHGTAWHGTAWHSKAWSGTAELCHFPSNDSDTV